MAEPAFDTLAIARELERDYGFEAKQAEGAATMIHRHLVGNVATKDDVKHLREEIKGLATKDELRAEIAEVRTEIAQASNRTIYTLGGLIGALFIIDRFLPLLGIG